MNMESLMGGASGWSQVRVMWEMGLCERRCKMFPLVLRIKHFIHFCLDFYS